MKHSLFHNYFLLVLISALLTELWIIKLTTESTKNQFPLDNVVEEKYQDIEMSGKEFNSYYNAIFQDVKYFPVPESSTDATLQVSFVDSWMAERTYGGQRGHEGTDIMASQDVAGVYPVVSMTDGIVRSKGWLEKGGYRIGIESPSGVYFYYAHLHSYSEVEIGDTIEAGTVLGLMGDSGYGKEGTTGQFPVHLHLGIYIYPQEKEMSVNPYWVLKYIENQKVKSAYSSSGGKQ